MRATREWPPPAPERREPPRDGRPQRKAEDQDDPSIPQYPPMHNDRSRCPSALICVRTRLLPRTGMAS
jgi:hypothetical protein